MILLQPFTKIISKHINISISIWWLYIHIYIHTYILYTYLFSLPSPYVWHFSFTRCFPPSVFVPCCVSRTGGQPQWCWPVLVSPWCFTVFLTNCYNSPATGSPLCPPVFRGKIPPRLRGRSAVFSFLQEAVSSKAPQGQEPLPRNIVTWKRSWHLNRHPLGLLAKSRACTLSLQRPSPTKTKAPPKFNAWYRDRNIKWKVGSPESH